MKEGKKNDFNLCVEGMSKNMKAPVRCCRGFKTVTIFLRCANPVVRLNYMVRWIQSKNTTIKYGLVMVFISKEKLHVSAYSDHLQVLIILC